MEQRPEEVNLSSLLVCPKVWSLHSAVERHGVGLRMSAALEFAVNAWYCFQCILQAATITFLLISFPVAHSRAALFCHVGDPGPDTAKHRAYKGVSSSYMSYIIKGSVFVLYVLYRGVTVC